MIDDIAEARAKRDAAEPSGLTPEREEEIRASSMEAGRKISNALFRGVRAVVDETTAGQAKDIAELRARVERLERLLAPKAIEQNEPTP